MSAIETTIQSFKRAWGLFEAAEEEKQELIKVITKHRPKLLGHVNGLIEMAKLAQVITVLAEEIAGQQQQIATEQDIATGKLLESGEEFKAKYIQATTLAFGLKALFNDPDTLSEALMIATPPTLKQALKSLSLEDRLKITRAFDEVIDEELLD